MEVLRLLFWNVVSFTHFSCLIGKWYGQPGGLTRWSTVVHQLKGLIFNYKSIDIHIIVSKLDFRRKPRLKPAGWPRKTTWCGWKILKKNYKCDYFFCYLTKLTELIVTMTWHSKATCPKKKKFSQEIFHKKFLGITIFFSCF